MQDPLENAWLDATRMPLALGKASELGLFPQGSLDRTTATRRKAVTAVTKLDIPQTAPLLWLLFLFQEERGPQDFRRTETNPPLKFQPFSCHSHPSLEMLKYNCGELAGVDLVQPL